MYYKALSDGPTEWAKELIKVMDDGCRVYNSDCVAAGGFDIKETAELYEKIIYENIGGD